MNIKDVFPNERGKIRNRERASQIRNFTGLRWGNITPTDIDGMIEYHNICYVWVETKLEGKDLDFGQKLALERVCDDLTKIKPCITIIATHTTPIEEDIDVANTNVSECRWKGKWWPMKSITTTKQLMDRFINWVNEDRAKQMDTNSTPIDDIPY